MFLVAATVTTLLAALLAFAALRKLTHGEHVVEEYARAGVPEDKLDHLALVLLAGAGGLVLGLAWAPIGVAAAIAVSVYFVVAIGFHIRAGDAEHLPTPAAMELIAVAALFLRLATL